MRMVKKWIAIFLIAVSLAACGDDSNPSGENGDSNQGSDTESPGYN